MPVELNQNARTLTEIVFICLRDSFGRYIKDVRSDISLKRKKVNASRDLFF